MRSKSVRPGMKDAFKTRKMQTIPLAVAPEVAPSPSSPSQGRSSNIPLAPPSSSLDSAWHTGDPATDRATDPALPVTGAIPLGKDRATLTVLAGINAGQVYALDGTEHTGGPLVDFDGRGRPDDRLVDTDGNGLADRVLCTADAGVTGYVDTDGDGRWDVRLSDTDGDGFADGASAV